MRQRHIPYRIIGAYDSETTNYDDHGRIIAFPILHQLGILDDTPISDITSDNVEEHCVIELYRHTHELYERLDSIVNAYTGAYVPVILCHNLAFDMYALAPWLNRHDVKVLAKSARKPITFTIKDESGLPVLVIWDTLIFSQQGLSRMGDDCGYHKAIGKWDYDLIRTPNTPLSEDELEYAKHDIYALLSWIGWWLKRNPDIEPGKLGLNVVTKTGIVRERRRVRFAGLKAPKAKNTVGNYWLYRCKMEAPKDDDELFTMLACTRGGFTFCASAHASYPYDLGESECIAGYDATSMHPAQLVSSFVPYAFQSMPPNVLELAFELIGKYTVNDVLDHWEKPFPVAFNASFHFTNLRPKENSLYANEGIFPLASARYKNIGVMPIDDDNGDKAAYDEHMKAREYTDSGINVKCAFGKIISADELTVYITELTAWEMYQCYEWDTVIAIHGYETGKFTRPTDMDIISVMQFYKAKNAFKEAREQFYSTGTIETDEELIELGIAPAIAQGMKDGTVLDSDVEAVYLGLKADLNSIFGISASNQYRRKTELMETGIEYVGEFGIVNAPKNPKVWYQFGQRIVGKSRIAQLCAIEVLKPYAIGIVNGDTDSVKIHMRIDDLGKAEKALLRIGKAIDKAKVNVCSRVKIRYPKMYDPLDYIGYYVNEFCVKQYCASWNKAYCTRSLDKRDGKMHFAFTLAGIPTSKRENDNSCFFGVNGYADRLMGLGYSFADVCNLLLGYNVTYSNDLILTNGRKFPEWGEQVLLKVTDYQGDTSLVAEPNALALYPMSKTINDTSIYDNACNFEFALMNNPNINHEHKLLFAGGVIDLGEIL